MPLRDQIEELAARADKPFTKADRDLFAVFKSAGRVRSAEPDSSAPTGWRVNTWVKQGILLGFRLGALVDMSANGALRFFDKDTYPVRPLTTADEVRIVPGGSSIRDGSFIARGVVCMPPRGR